MQSNYRTDLDGLRALAVLFVTFYHYKLHPAFEGGFLGVDVFFVLSGYFITESILNNLENSNFSLKDFYLRRCHRLLPAFIFHIIICLITAIAILSPSELIIFGQTLISSVTSTSNFYFWLNSSYFDSALKINPLLHTWSLSVEWQFYLVWPFLFIFLFKLKSYFKILIFLIFLSIISVSLSNFIQLKDPNAAFYLMPFRAFELAIGAIGVFVLRQIKVNKWIANILAFVGLSIIMTSVLIFEPTNRTSSFALLIPCLGTLMLVVANSKKTYISKILSFKPLVFLGKISYSFYLFHWPVYVFLKIKTPDYIEVEVLLLTTFILSLASYYFVENPLRLRSNKNNKFAPLSTALAMIFVCFIIVSISGSMISNGMLWRVNLNSSITRPILEASLQNLHVFYGGFDCRANFCHIPPRIKANNKKTIIVMGDSHSKAFYAGIKNYFLSDEIFFYVSSGCTFFSFEYVSVLNYPPYVQSCDEIRKLAFEKINTTNDNSIVILSQNWDLEKFTNGTETLNFKMPSKDLNKFVFDQIQILTKTLKINNLIVIGNVPTTGNNPSPLSCVSQPFKNNKGCLKTTVDKIDSRRIFNNVLSEHLKNTSITFKDPFGALCSKNECLNFVNEYPVYSDDNHLSIWGSELVINKLFNNELKL